MRWIGSWGGSPHHRAGSVGRLRVTEGFLDQRRVARGFTTDGLLAVRRRGHENMSEPTIELIPRKLAVCSDAPITPDVLARATSPTPEVHSPRPPLNLGLVLDRSGSM